MSCQSTIRSSSSTHTFLRRRATAVDGPESEGVTTLSLQEPYGRTSAAISTAQAGQYNSFNHYTRSPSDPACTLNRIHTLRLGIYVRKHHLSGTGMTERTGV